MSLPVVLPGSCCPVTGVSQLAEPMCRNRPRGLSASSRFAGGGPRLLLPGRPLLSLGLLQLLLGGSMVALSFGALSLSSSPAVRNSCPFWAGSSVILSGIVGLTTWRRPMLLLVNIFVFLSVVCVLLNLAGFVLCCQGAQLVSSMTSCQLNWDSTPTTGVPCHCRDLCFWRSEDGHVCYCCSLSSTSTCPEEKLLQLHPAQSCSTMRILLKKVLFALCALNALTTAVCLMAAALRYLQIFSTAAPCVVETRATVEEREEPSQVPDSDEFVAPAPPPSYFSTFYSCTPRLAYRMPGDSVIPLPHIYRARIKGVEVFCPLDPPPPYEVAARSSTHTVTQVPDTELMLNNTPPTCAPDLSPQMVSVSPDMVHQAKAPLHPPLLPPLPPGLTPWRRAGIHRSTSDPVLMDLTAKGWSSSDTPLPPPPQTTDSSTQTSQPTLADQGQVTLRRGNNHSRIPCRPRPSSMVDYSSYRHTQKLVRRILEQPAAQGVAPEVQELVDSIRNVLQSDEKHMEEAVRCASYIDQVFTDSAVGPSSSGPPQQQQPAAKSQTFPRRPRRRYDVLHLRSCGDLSSFTCAAFNCRENQADRREVVLGVGSRTGSCLDCPDRPHSLIGVFRETVL